ncbi:MAG: alpha/beta hydrolase [Candidatus Omnitrophica bacterium]|nr:alpha/beta hydrolase [Candidatus Omnitrophota bacterium]
MAPAAGKIKYHAVILVHGFGGTKEESGMFDDIAKKASEIDCLVYRFDFSGCGESEGEGANHGLEPGRKRVYKIVADWFKKHLAG